MIEAKDTVVLRQLGIETKISCHQIVNSKLATVTEESQSQWFFFSVSFFSFASTQQVDETNFLCHSLFSFTF